jgi:hypothetical protein
MRYFGRAFASHLAIDFRTGCLALTAAMGETVSRALTADDYTRGPDGPESPVVSVAYRINADAHPDVLLRIAAALNFANQAPGNLSMRLSGIEQVIIETSLRAVPAILADMIRRKLMQLTCVISVEMRPWP